MLYDELFEDKGPIHIPAQIHSAVSITVPFKLCDKMAVHLKDAPIQGKSAL